MSCPCQKTSPGIPVNPDLPTLTDVAAVCANCEPVTPSGVPCEDVNALHSTGSCGYTLPSNWTDAVCDSQGAGITLLGRIKSKLARLNGSGFIQIVNGKAFVVPSVPLKILTLWHRWFRPTTASVHPILGEPLPSPYQVIGDTDGNLHLIKGLETEDSAQVWNADLKQWEPRSLSDFTLSRRGQLPRTDALELVGYEAIPNTGTGTEIRTMKILSGSGIIVVDQVITTPTECLCEGCDQSPGIASIARFLPYPEGSGPFTLKYTLEDGPIWVEDT